MQVNELLANESDCRPEYSYSARMYGTEALCLLEKSEEAVNMLEPLIQKDLFAGTSSSPFASASTSASASLSSSALPSLHPYPLNLV